MNRTFSRSFCYSNKNELLWNQFQKRRPIWLEIFKIHSLKTLRYYKESSQKNSKTSNKYWNKKIPFWNRKIHNSQNLSHTNDQIHRAKLILFKLKSTKIDVYFETPSKNRDISIFLQGFCPASIRHDSKHTSATITENRWVRSHTSALLTNAFQKVEALILTIRS